MAQGVKTSALYAQLSERDFVGRREVGSVSVIICQFDSGVKVGVGTKYEAFKRSIVKAVKFSVFEATASMKRARFFEALCHDPEIETTPLQFPWTAVRVRPKEGA